MVVLMGSEFFFFWLKRVWGLAYASALFGYGCLIVGSWKISSSPGTT
jgi:hypothetical protein